MRFPRFGWGKSCVGVVSAFQRTQFLNLPRQVALAPFLVHRFIVAPTMATVKPTPANTAVSYSSESNVKDTGKRQDTIGNYWRRRHATPRALRRGVEHSLDLLSLLRAHRLSPVADAVVLLLVEVAGLKLSSQVKHDMLFFHLPLTSFLRLYIIICVAAA